MRCVVGVYIGCESRQEGPGVGRPRLQRAVSVSTALTEDQETLYVGSLGSRRWDVAGLTGEGRGWRGHRVIKHKCSYDTSTMHTTL